jgi:FkbM family methyltransferase
MPFTSYTRNFEDVMLNRVFSRIENGFFMDVGGCHPVQDSNTFALSRRGWRGIVIEPARAFAPLWPQIRPNDIFLNAAAGATKGSVTFFELDALYQMATTTPEIAQRHRDAGRKVTEVVVPVVTLNDVLAQHRPVEPVHCLSIDVEGGEKSVLEGLDLTRFRPWLIMLESVEPGRRTPNFAGWEPLLLEQDYEFVYFDMVNRFYLAKEHADLKMHFSYPPCVWDNFEDAQFVAAREAVLKAQAELASLKQQFQQLVNQM